MFLKIKGLITSKLRAKGNSSPFVAIAKALEMEFDKNIKEQTPKLAASLLGISRNVIEGLRIMLRTDNKSTIDSKEVAEAEKLLVKRLAKVEPRIKELWAEMQEALEPTSKVAVIE